MIALNKQFPCCEIHLVGVKVSSCDLNRDGLLAAHTQLAGQCLYDRIGDLVLNRKNIDELAVEIFGPQMTVAAGFDELRRDTNAIAILSHTSLENVADIQGL